MNPSSLGRGIWLKKHATVVSKKRQSLKSDLEKLIASLQENLLRGETNPKATSKAIGGRQGFYIRNSYKIMIEYIYEIPHLCNIIACKNERI
jgi:hypothetical protein